MKGEKVDNKETGAFRDGAFIMGLGTIRICIDCGILVAGGPTRCVRCAKEGAPCEAHKLMLQIGPFRFGLSYRKMPARRESVIVFGHRCKRGQRKEK